MDASQQLRYTKQDMMHSAVSILFFVANIVILAYLVPLPALALFFIASAILVQYKYKFRSWIGTLGASCLLVFLVWYYRAGALNALGVSYCFLRSTYAIASEKQYSFTDFTKYYFFAPTFFSGPIIHPDDFLAQKAFVSSHNLTKALVRIYCGACKLCLSLLAQTYISVIAPNGMESDIARLSVTPLTGIANLFISGVWLYLNFSGISEICIGVSLLFGITVPENFSSPFKATDITDFWRRWHMSLAAWLRACIYTPIARFLNIHSKHGNFFGETLPPLITMLVCGVWHAFAMEYLIWGGLHGLGLIVHGQWKKYAFPKIPQFARNSIVYTLSSWILTHGYILLTWVFFFPSPEPSLRVSLLYLTRVLGIVNHQVDLFIHNLFF